MNQDLDSAKKENHVLQNMTKLILFSQIQFLWADKLAEWRSTMASFAKENAQYHAQLTNTWQVVQKLTDESS